MLKVHGCGGCDSVGRVVPYVMPQDKESSKRQIWLYLAVIKKERNNLYSKNLIV